MGALGREKVLPVHTHALSIHKISVPTDTRRERGNLVEESPGPIVYPLAGTIHLSKKGKREVRDRLRSQQRNGSDQRSFVTLFFSSGRLLGEGEGMTALYNRPEKKEGEEAKGGAASLRREKASFGPVRPRSALPKERRVHRCIRSLAIALRRREEGEGAEEPVYVKEKKPNGTSRRGSPWSSRLQRWKEKRAEQTNSS